MIDKSTYIQMKRDIKCVCRKDLLDLCDKMELTQLERNMLFRFYDGDMVQSICMDMCISPTTYTKYMKRILSKIYYYKNTH
mgnify:FL=1